jgi:archaellum biogenesis ATPase FlaH
MSISQVVPEKLFNFIEVAIGPPSNRGRVIPKSTLPKHISTDHSLYRSTYLYDESAKLYAEEHGSLKGYYGVRAIDHLVIDIDKGEDSHDEVRKRTVAFIDKLITMKVDESSVQVFYSGTGYHVTIHKDVFGFKPARELPYTVKNTVDTLFPEVDNSIYQPMGLYRVMLTPNGKSSLLKTPVSYEELRTLPVNELRALCKAPREDFDYKSFYGRGQLHSKITTVDIKTALRPTTAAPSDIAPCIQRLYNAGPQRGERHATALRLVSHFRRSGMPLAAAQAALLDWNDSSLDDMEIIRVLENGYKAGYRYGCHDKMLHDNCNTKCIYYKKKDYLVDVYNAEEMQKDLEQRLGQDWTGRTINIGEMLGTDSPSIIYPGELVTIFGPTGSNKSTLAHNIALGWNFHTQQIEPERHIHTLYLSLELPTWYFQQRSLNIVSGSPDESFSQEQAAKLYKDYGALVAHVGVQMVTPSIEDIRRKVREIHPKLVIVDYIDLIETPGIRGEYEQINHISHSLSNMAVNEDVIIIQISQVSRAEAREGLTINSGKGSGAIENASRRVVGISGDPDGRDRVVEQFKATHGKKWGPLNMTLQDGFRLVRA